MNHIINDLLMSLKDIGREFCSYSASIFVQSSLLVVILFVIDLLLRRRVRAIFRYCVWLLVLVKLILPPTLSLPTGIGYWTANRLPEVSSHTFDLSEPGVTSVPVETPAIQPSENLVEHAPAAVTVNEPLTPLAWQAMIFILWLMGVLAFSLVLIQRMRFVRGLVARSNPASDELLGVLEQCRSQMSVRRKVRLQLSEAVSSPAVCGLLKPVVLMPADLVEKLSSAGLRATLIHELAHIKRGDLWVNAVQTALQVVYFYNPFVWLANSIIRKVCEEAVDETVLVALGGKAKDYSNTLIDISEMAFWRIDLGLRLIGVAESKKALQWRIRHMLNRPIPKSARLGVIGIAALLVIAAVLLPMVKAEKSGSQSKSGSGENEVITDYPLHEAATNGDIEQVRLNLARDIDIESKDRSGKTALHIAANKGHEEIARLLISKGADVNAKDSWNRHPLFYASLSGHKDVAEVLIANGAIVSATVHYNGMAAIHVAARSGHKDVVELLLANGADPSGGTTKMPSPAELAMEGNHTEIVKLLISKGADISPLHFAIHLKDLAKVQSLIEDGADVNKRTPFGATPLHMAVRAGLKDISKLLIDKGAEINATETRGRTPLHEAAERGQKDMVEMLLANRADVDAGAQYNRTAAEMAMQKGYTEIVELLIANGADISPLHFAIYREDGGKARRLIEGGADINKRTPYGTTPLHRAIDRGLRDIARLLIDRGANVNAKDNYNLTPLHSAAQRGYSDIVELLIAKGAYVNALDCNSNIPFWLAWCEDHKDTAELLAANGADSNTEINWTPLHTAAEEGNINAAKRLIAEGANVNATASRDHTPLHIAARQGHKKMVELLLEHGAEVNAGAVYRITAATMAMGKRHTEIVELLIANGADIPPLHFAIYTEDEGKARRLIEGGADVNKRTPYGFTPLHRAVDRGLRDIVELLIDRGADVNAKDNWNWTPLHSAAYGHKEIAELLIAKGADVHACDGGGWSPLYYALKEGHPQVAELLREHGAKK